jgi:transcriptional regulator with XRE-family HTH domain
MGVGERIAERLKEAGISQAELARRVSLTQPTINALIRGSSRSSAHLHKIARELGTTPAYLAGETDDPDSDAAVSHLTREEFEWIDLLHALATADRKALLQLARSLSNEARAPTLHSPRPEFRSQAA